ncbi:MAG: GntR family transcriptional regulator [Proteobacteria bacterium]|nr:GntR family transcriptional regulator [Pseudomonadota bacterium]
MSRASSKAYEAIRSRILTGEFAPGAHLKEEELAEVCGVSRTPIRDALRALSAEEYVRVVPNHGTYVSEWSDDDIKDIFTLRAILEGHAALLASGRAMPGHIEELSHLHRTMSTVLEKEDEPDRDVFVQSNRRFHEIITEAAGSRRLTQMIGRLVEQPLIARTAISYTRVDLQRSNHQHGELIAAFRARDGAWAQAVMKSHILAAYQAYKLRYKRSCNGNSSKAAE